MRLGLISDTHGLLRPEAELALANVDIVLHSGDIGSPEILERLKIIAPVFAVRGNNDTETEWPDLPTTFVATWEGVSILMLHELEMVRPKMLSTQPNLIIFGHSHKPATFENEGVTYINPGAAGGKRFSLPVSVAVLTLNAGKWSCKWINLLDDRVLP